MGVVGDVYTGQFFLVNEENNKMLTINLTYQIVETIIQAEIVGEEWIFLPVSMDDEAVDYDLTKVATAFGLESVSALFEGYYVKGLKADGTYTEGLDAINSGVILNTSGAAVEYGDIGIGFSEDYKQIWTYSNVDIVAPFKAEATFCFEIDSKRYIIHATLLDTESYVVGIEGISADKKVLLVLPEGNVNLQLSCRNLTYIKPVLAQNVCTYDVMNASVVVMVEGAENVLNTLLA